MVSIFKFKTGKTPVIIINIVFGGLLHIKGAGGHGKCLNIEKNESKVGV
jgi:hypothetical protein